MSDHFRTEIGLEVYCEKHPQNKLTFTKNKKVSNNSAHQTNVAFFAYPCSECEHELNTIKGAIKVVNSIIIEDEQPSLNETENKTTQ